MRGVPAFVGLSVVLLAVAGCLGGEEPLPGEPAQILDHDAIADLIGGPIEVIHDHRDPTHPDHNGGVNLELVSWSTLGVTLGENGFANFVFYDDEDEELAFVAVDGDQEAGFVIADIADPATITPIGSYFFPANSVQEVRVTPDGRFAVLNVQSIPGVDDLAGMSLQGCNVCLHLFDVSDRTTPRWLDALPIDNIGTHNMHITDWGGTPVVFYVGQPASYAFPTNLPGNYVGVALIDESTGKIVPVSQWRDPTVANAPGRSFPHDVIVEYHPITGKLTGYVSQWDGGAITVDFTDLVHPLTLDVDRTQDGSGALAIHWFAPEPEPRANGRLIAWSAPEIDLLETDSGVIRAYDITDPGDIQHLGYWGLPGNVSIPDAFVFSGHTVNVDMDTGLAAVAHYHAGVWVLDATDPANPRHLAYYMPFGNATHAYDGPIWWKKPNFNPDGFGPNAYQARWKDGLLWVTERGTGLYVLDYTGPVPGPIA